MSTYEVKFRKAIKAALDTYHPNWRKRHKNMEFEGKKSEPLLGVWAETLRKWVDGPDIPQESALKNHLDKANYPPATRREIEDLCSRARNERMENKRLQVSASEDDRELSRFQLIIQRLTSHRWLVVLTLLIVVVIFITAFALVRPPTTTPNPPCSESIRRADPPFLPNQGFSLYRSENAEVLGASLLDDNVRSLGINQQGLWVGYMPLAEPTDRVSLFDKENWVHYCTQNQLLPQQHVNGFAFFNDLVFMATDGAGIGEFNGTRWRFYTQADGLPSNVVYSFTVHNNELWASTYNGVVRFENGGWQVEYQAHENELTSNHVLTFFVDTSGNRWFAHIDEGISRLDESGQWYSYFANDLNLRNITGVAMDDNGSVWFGTDKSGVIRFEDDRWTIFNVAEGHLPSNRVQDMARDGFGRIWAATAGGLVYTADFGQTWVIHSTMDTLDVEFGCQDCPYFDQTHMLLVLKGGGIGHIRIPPLTPTIEIVRSPSRVTRHPNEEYIFEIEVRVLSESLTPSNGDSLRNSDPLDTFLFGAYPIIAVSTEVLEGGTYTFSNVDNPIIAPEQAGIYTTYWRVFQGRRFVTEPIVVEFEVIANE